MYFSDEYICKYENIFTLHVLCSSVLCNIFINRVRFMVLCSPRCLAGALDYYQNMMTRYRKNDVKRTMKWRGRKIICMLLSITKIQSNRQLLINQTV